MEPAEKALTIFPVNLVFFILAVGLFIVISFPYNLSSIFSGNLFSSFGNPSLNPINSFSICMQASFQPFASSNLLSNGDFLTGLGVLILCSFPVGACVYLVYSIYEFVNHIPVLFYFWIRRKKWTSKPDRLKEKQIDQIEFLDFATRIRILKFLIFQDTLQEISIAFLYGSETFLAMIIFSIVFIGFGQLWLTWLMIAVFVCVFFGIVYLSYKKKYEKTYESVLLSFQKDRKRIPNSFDY